MKLLTRNRTWRRARLHFWLYVDREVLEHFFSLVRDGCFGQIARAHGRGQDRLGRAVSISYEAGRLELTWPDPAAEPEPGWVEIEGRFTSADLIQMRNHTTFHLRGFFRQQPGRTAAPKNGPPPGQRP